MRKEASRTFSDWLARMWAGKKPAVLAREVNVSFATVDRWLKGRAVPSPVYFSRLAIALNVSEAELAVRATSSPAGDLEGIETPYPEAQAADPFDTKLRLKRNTKIAVAAAAVNSVLRHKGVDVQYYSDGTSSFQVFLEFLTWWRKAGHPFNLDVRSNNVAIIDLAVAADEGMLSLAVAPGTVVSRHRAILGPETCRWVAEHTGPHVFHVLSTNAFHHALGPVGYEEVERDLKSTVLRTPGYLMVVADRFKLRREYDEIDTGAASPDLWREWMVSGQRRLWMVTDVSGEVAGALGALVGNASVMNSGAIRRGLGMLVRDAGLQAGVNDRLDEAVEQAANDHVVREARPETDRDLKQAFRRALACELENLVALRSALGDHLVLAGPVDPEEGE
jgi:transcriptional regulator with XRE-family HTH domain